MLSVKEIENSKPTDKPQKLFDGGGLYLEVSPAGGKLWRYKYRFMGKEKRLALGAYRRKAYNLQPGRKPEGRWNSAGK